MVRQLVLGESGLSQSVGPVQEAGQERPADEIQGMGWDAEGSQAELLSVQEVV